jgi:formylmethanofuran dehydrogenase subunit A
MLTLPQVTHVYLCHRPSNLRWGLQTLIEHCRADMKVELASGVVCLFFNRERTVMQLLFALGPHTHCYTVHALANAPFTLPAQDPGAFTRIPREDVERWFSSSTAL